MRFTDQMKERKNKDLTPFCADNTCDEINAPDSLDKNVFDDFVFLYLYYYSGSIILSKPYITNPPFIEAVKDKVPSVLERNLNYCESDVKDVKCILCGMADIHNIEIYFVRHDKGEEVKVRQFLE